MVESCINEDAHIMLRDFGDELGKWERGSRTQKAIPLLEKLQYFHTDGVTPSGHGPLDICCKRFLLNVENALSETTKRFRLVHDNYWDVWGHIAGRLLSKGKGENARHHLATKIQANLKKDFSVNDWSERQLITRGFATLAEKSLGYDEYILDIIKYLYSYCDAAMSAFNNKLPRVIQESVQWVIMAQKSISKRYSEGQLNGVDYNDFLMALLNLSLQSLDLINRIWKEKRDWNVIALWRESVFQYLFPIKQLETKFTTKSPDDVRKAFNIFTSRLHEIRQQQEYMNIHEIIDNWLTICKKFRKISL